MMVQHGRILGAVVVMALAGGAFGQAVPGEVGPRSFKYSFGNKAVAGYTQVAAGARYSDAVGYGFENAGGVFPTAVADDGEGLQSGHITGVATGGGSNEVFFSVKVPEGNYRVTVTLGGANEETETTVRAELRRLMLERVKAAPGELVTRTFAVNVHKPPILNEAGVQVNVVKVSGREVAGRGGAAGAVGVGAFANLNRTQGGEGWSWDDTLTLEFVGKSAVCAVDIERDDTIKNVFICGDSTVCDQPAEPFTSWGQVITRWIKPDYAVSNYAISGNTAAAFYAANRMAKIVSQLHPGDYVFVQYGHNDMKSTAANALESYKGFYERFIADTRAKGAVPVMMTPVSRKTWGADGKISNSFLVNSGRDDYVAAVREVVKAKECMFIDLNASSALFYEAIGRANIQPAFANASESTHHSDWGSYEVAKCVVQGIVDLKLPLAKSLTDDWVGYDPKKPDLLVDFKIPGDPLPAGGRGVTPAGN